MLTKDILNFSGAHPAIAFLVFQALRKCINSPPSIVYVDRKLEKVQMAFLEARQGCACMLLIADFHYH
jgi:hypothetical protein